MQAMHGIAAFCKRTRLVGGATAMVLALAALVLASTASAAGPPIVETKPAAGVGQTEAVLKGKVDPNHVDVTTCNFEYGTTISYGKSVSCTPPAPIKEKTSVEAQVTGLTVGTSYHFRVTATNKEGTTNSTDETFKTKTPPHKEYLGLGDSLSFGFSQQLFNENLPEENPSAFEHGFVNDYFNMLSASALPATGVWRLTNDGCPGETSDSFIGNGVLAKELALRGATGEPACAYHNVNKFLLHNEYGASYTFEGKPTLRSQLENALSVIKEHNTDTNPGDPVTIVSLEIGANDKLRGIAQCEAEIEKEFIEIAKGEKTKSQYGGSTPDEAFKSCVGVHLFVTIKHIITNQVAIMFAIRNGSKFCVDAETTPCDAAHKGVNFSGKIILGGAYDPFGRVFCKGETFASPGHAPPSCEPEEEILESSNVLTSIINTAEETKSAVAGHACYSDPQFGLVLGGGSLATAFDPGILELISVVFAGSVKAEPFQLQTLTNMDNKTTSNGKPNGDGKKGDIHPTPLGYEVLAEGMKGACGL